MSDRPEGTSKQKVDVIIVGAGPVGLSLALDLARTNIRVVVLEKDSSTAERSRAPAIWPRTQEYLARLDVLDSLVKEGVLKEQLVLRQPQKNATLLRLPFDESAAETPFPRLLVIPQSRTERLLAEALEKEPSAELFFRSKVTAIEEGPRSVTVTYSVGNGQTQTLKASFVAGCDGAHSVTRESIEGELEGRTYPVQVALADIHLGGSDELEFPRLSTQGGAAIGLRMGPGLWRLILPFTEDNDSVLENRVRCAVREMFPTSMSETAKIVWTSGFRIHRRLSSRFWRGRVVLAGDAAHLNSPVGGQGMNVGMHDAAWLADSLRRALEAESAAPLSDYAARRREAAGTVNAFTDRVTRLLLGSGMLFSTRGRFIAPALSVAGAVLRVPAIRRRVMRRVTMLDQSLPP